ncbi:MAG TPA: FecR domain-containing protein [Aggregatilineales bacterium]|nr:FecR domain-containing protein [Aggregatilineales bacterium]HQA67007.1 FecR domain-containing protein [Aggregatilineales bacterium]HQE17149.1 FecR domain-containing protein [Aggregatilineales bacterium]
MFRHKYWVLGGASAILLFLGAFIFTSPTVAEATLVVSEGEVVVEHGTTRLFVVPTREQRTVTAGETLALKAGDTVQLHPGATAQLRLLNGSTVDLSEGALLHITELVNTRETFRVRLYLFAGRTVNRIEHLLDVDDAFVISTPSSTTSVRGTVFAVEVLSEDSTVVTVDEGSVFVSTEDAGVEVPAGFKLRVEVGQPLGLPEPKPAWEPPLMAEVDSRVSAPVLNTVSPCEADPAACVTPAADQPPADQPAPVAEQPQPARQQSQRPAPVLAAAQPTVRPTATLPPTATPKPTLTPTLPPTNTSVPTATPTSVPTVAPTATQPPPTDPPPPPPTDPPTPEEPTPTATNKPSANVTEPPATTTPEPEPTSGGIGGNCIGGDCDDAGTPELPTPVCGGPAGGDNPHCPPPGEP